MQKPIILFILLSTVFILSGCSTVKNTCQYTSKGTASFITDPIYGFYKGVREDTQEGCKLVERLDNWIEENFW